MRVVIGRALNVLIAREANAGVAHHHFDVHILEPGTNRYRGRLCHFAQCPKPGKTECFVPGCGAQPFLRQFPGYELEWTALLPEYSAVLFSRERDAAEYEVDIPF